MAKKIWFGECIMSLKKGAMYVFIANIINLIISLFTGFVLPKYLSIET